MSRTLLHVVVIVVVVVVVVVVAVKGKGKAIPEGSRGFRLP